MLPFHSPNVLDMFLTLLDSQPIFFFLCPNFDYDLKAKVVKFIFYLLKP